jgi:hypothetical protein
MDLQVVENRCSPVYTPVLDKAFCLFLRFPYFFFFLGCAARAFCDCPAIISHRPRSQNILKEAQLNPEIDSRIKKPRSQVSLEKSSQNYKPLDK